MEFFKSMYFQFLSQQGKKVIQLMQEALLSLYYLNSEFLIFSSLLNFRGYTQGHYFPLRLSLLILRNSQEMKAVV